MYISLDALPELTPEYQQAQLQAVQDAKVVYQFEEVIVPATDYWAISIWVATAGLLLWLGSLIGWVGIVLFSILVFALSSYYYAGNPDTKQTVTLTEKGIIVTDLTLVPDACFAALRYSGYAGIAISLIGVVLVGPMMFVGAGAGLLMSFKMAGVTNQPRIRVRPFNPNIEYEMADNQCMKFKNNLILRRVVPRIRLENDGGEKDDLFSDNKEFYFLTYASTEQEQIEMMRHLKRFIKVEHEDYYHL
ncbi:hypothetical protein TW84_11055 [Vibrio neptunius]|uniref:hypothetical protein n=1 Tax=Vibrio neptunius TaxID=170651 RepID=UPI0005FA58E9|nr:hypothetical protein [Vibrio neptunius]KJY89891.1 hypothetical protein TW84_11055 [Vibrio neptunius]